MAFDSVFRSRGSLLFQLKTPGVHISRTLAPHRRTECLHNIQTVPRDHSRTLVTAVTYSPRVTIADPRPPPARVVGSLVDAALSWANVDHRSADPPSHAIILVSKELIPSGEVELVAALGRSEQLRGLDALVGVVDYMECGSKGASVLLASKSENVTIEQLSGVEEEVLRVGRWHAKDVEEDGPFDFDNMMASIRGTEAPTVVVKPKSSSKKELVFTIGEAKSIQGQISCIRQTYPNATIMGTTLATTPTINGLFTTMIRNGVIIPSGDVVTFRIPRSESERYNSPYLRCGLTWLGEKCGATITSCSGNLVLELDNKPAMPQLLSILPSPSQKEEIKPRPLVAKISLPTGSDSSSFCANVLGGSQSRGGIALDPLIASGHLAVGKKIRFAQAHGAMESNFFTPEDSKAVHICLQSTDPRKSYESINDTDFDSYKRITEPIYQGLRKGLFCAESGEGFLMGKKGVVPWLCRVPGSTAKLRVTATTEEEHGVVSQRLRRGWTRMTVASAHWTAVKDESFRSWWNEQGVEEIKSTGVAQDDEKDMPSEPLESPTTASQSQPEESQPEEFFQPTLLGRKRFNSLPPDKKALLRIYPKTAKLVQSGKYDLRLLPYDSRWFYNVGDRRFSFRARADWFPFRAGTLKRSNLWQYGPGGTKLTRQRGALYKAPTRKQAWESQQLSSKHANWLKSINPRDKDDVSQNGIDDKSDEKEDSMADTKEPGS